MFDHTMRNFTLLFLLLPLVALSQSISGGPPPSSIFIIWENDQHPQVIYPSESVNLPAEFATLVKQFPVVSIGKPFKYFPLGQRITLPPGTDPKPLMEALSNVPGIANVEKAPVYTIGLKPNDQTKRQDWYYNLIEADNMWDLGFGDSSVVIAVVDDAVQIDHPDLNDAIYTNPNEIPGNGIDDDLNGFIDDTHGYDLGSNDTNVKPPLGLESYYFHGTHTSGIAGATTNNNLGVASLGGGITLLPVKATDYPYFLTKVEEGMEYAVLMHPDIISMSFGGADSSLITSAIFDTAVQHGIILVAAAGNTGTDVPNYPAAYNGVIAVGSVSRGDKISSFSNYGDWIDVMAPGDSIYSTYPPDLYKLESGTSMATPMVAALCGLILSHHPDMTPERVEECLKWSCDDIYSANDPFYAGSLGAGRINAWRAVVCSPYASTRPISSPSPLPFLFPNPGNGQIRLVPEGFDLQEPLSIEIIDMLGRRVKTTLVKGSQFYDVELTNPSAGLYQVRLEQAGHVAVLPMMVD